MFLLLVTIASSQNTWYDSETGNSYDWGILERSEDNYYKVIDSMSFFIPSIYSFNFGTNLPRTCAGQFHAAMESIEFVDGWMESCSILGRYDMQTISVISNGIQVTYTGGDLCYEVSEINTRRISFRLVCSEAEGDWEIIQSTYVNYCHVILQKKTPAGCAEEPMSSIVWGLLLVLICLGLYFGGGTAYNYYTTSEFKVPHIESINNALGSVQETTQGGIKKVKGYLNEAGAKSKNYEMV
jgi:hypothetical protein